MKERFAVIDLGTNTFHLFIVEIEGDALHILYKEKIAVKIGKNGISKGLIAKDAMKRALHTLKVFKTVIDQFEVLEVRGVATSAIRSAKNGQDLLDLIKVETGITINRISGEEEAELIYYGARAAVDFGHQPQLIMDIGGGSVEFIIGDGESIYWKQSFEIGAQRLLDKFHQVDPMPEEKEEQLYAWLANELKPLTDAIVLHGPVGLTGCSGTFDTLAEIFAQSRGGDRPLEHKTFNLDRKDYLDIHHELITKNKAQRLEIPGMVTMRVDMIVVASCLIHFVLDRLNCDTITCCSYALKEGILFHNFKEKVIKG